MVKDVLEDVFGLLTFKNFIKLAAALVLGSALVSCVTTGNGDDTVKKPEVEVETVDQDNEMYNFKKSFYKEQYKAGKITSDEYIKLLDELDELYR